MTFKKDSLFTHYAVPAPTTGGMTSPKYSPTLDVRSIVSDPSSLNPTPNFAYNSTLPINTPTHMPINTILERTEALKIPVNDTVETISYLTAYMSYEPKTVLLQLAQLRKELNIDNSTYQASVPHPIKYLLRMVTYPIKLIIRHLRGHP